MTQQPRLLYIGNHAGHFVSHRLPIVLRARAAGYAVQVAFPPAPAEVERIHGEGLPYHPIPLSRQGKNPLAELATLRAINTLITHTQPHIVHNFTIKPVIYGSTLARLRRVPAVVNSITGLGALFVNHDPRTRALRGVVKWAYRAALHHPNSRLIFQNPDDQAVFNDSGILPSERSLVIKGSGVDLTQFTPQPFPDGDPVIVMASRMMWEKGVGEFVEAARRLRAEGVRARFLLVGDSDPGHRGMIDRTQLAAWHAEGAVEWVGFRADMPAVFAEAHIVCLPSYYREGIPKVLIEAAAAGRPIITTDTPGCREIVRAGENGLLIPKRDVDALTAALRRLIDAPAEREQMGARGRSIALDGFRIEQIAAQIVAVYAELLARAGIAAPQVEVFASCEC